MLVPFLLLCLAPLLVNAGTLTVTTSNGTNLTLKDWEYREISTRSGWYLGCWEYDFLQGSGWFRSTWRQEIAPISNGNATNTVSYEVQRTSRANYCNSMPDEINFIDLEYALDDGTVLEGYARIVPDETQESEGKQEVTIQCAEAGGVIDSPCFTCGLVCEEAKIPWTGRETIEVNIVWIS